MKIKLSQLRKIVAEELRRVDEVGHGSMSAELEAFYYDKHDVIQAELAAISHALSNIMGEALDYFVDDQADSAAPNRVVSELIDQHIAGWKQWNVK